MWLLSQNSDGIEGLLAQGVESKRCEMTSTSSQLPFVVVRKRRQGRKRGARGNLYQEIAAIESASGHGSRTQCGADGHSHRSLGAPSPALPRVWSALRQDSPSRGSPTLATSLALGTARGPALPPSTDSLSELRREAGSRSLGTGLGAGHQCSGPSGGGIGPASELAGDGSALPAGLEGRSFHRAAGGGLRVESPSSSAFARPGHR